MLTPDELTTVVTNHKAAQANITDRTAQRILSAWEQLGSWERADVERFVASIAPDIAAAKAASVRLANALYSLVLDVPPARLSAEKIATTYNADAAFQSFWHALSEGRDFGSALDAGGSTAQAQVANFVTSTARQTGGTVAKQSGRQLNGWARVPSATACEWCQLVSLQTYHSAESADFGHDRCDCTAVPIAG